MERLDRRAAWVRRLLLPRGLSLPHGRPPQLHQPRDRTDAGQLGQPQRRAQGVLRAHGTVLHLHALPGRGEQGSAEELPGHGSARLRLSLVPSVLQLADQSVLPGLASCDIFSFMYISSCTLSLVLCNYFRYVNTFRCF